MTTDEILHAVREIFYGDIDDAAISQYLDNLENALPHSEISDLIFWDFRGLTPEQVVDEAMQREMDHTR